MRKDISAYRRFLIDRLGYLRSRANLSARELSQRLGYSVAYIAKFENGDFNIPAEVLMEAIEICNSCPEEFFWKDISKYKEQRDVINKYEKLSEDSKSTINNLLKNLK